MLRLQYGKEERPDHLLAADNGEAPRDVSLALRERTRPFRRLPADGQTLALGFDRRLEDGPIQLLWSPTDRATPADFDPRLAWTYSRQATDAGAGGEVTEWAVPDVADGTERLLTRGLISVVFPDASEAVGLFGAARHWLRASVVEGAFETPPPATGPADLAIRIDRIDAPRETIRLRNTGDRSLDLSGYLVDVEHGNLDVDQHRALPGGTVIDAGGTLTVASGRLSPGPADVWFDFRAPVLNDTVPDEVALLTPSGDPVAVGGGPVAGEEASEETDERGADSDADTGGDSTDESGHDCGCGGHAGDDHADCGRPGHADSDPCETTLPTESSVGDPTETPPVVEVLAVNAGWATNVESVTDELLGGSDGTADQTFAVASPPVVAESVWVDEARTLSTADREGLVADAPEQVEVVGGGATGDTDSAPDAVWVRWTAVEDFLGSGPDDRHYTVDRLSGEIQFGDGRRGRIPPRGRDTVRASYETGGGSAGNVPRETVTKLESAIALVDEVTNPIAGDGGADAESTESAVTRASRTLRDGDRAVTPVDFERVATTTTRKLARARCLPATDAAGRRRAGFVTLIVVPASSARKPVPSASLRERVAERVADHAPTTVVTPDRLIVRGPAYVEATVAVRVVATPGVESVSAVERAVDDALSAYLHPLSGGESGEGWAFGTLPCPADLFAVAEGVAGVDHVADLTVTFHGDETTARVGDGDEVPGVSEDVLVFAGTHDVRASRASPATATTGADSTTAADAGATSTTDAGTGGGA
nr:putative baseplate assembly protein [Salinirubrum litoreum]